MIERMPENAPPKWMFRNISAIRANTDRKHGANPGAARKRNAGHKQIAQLGTAVQASLIVVAGVPHRPTRGTP